MIEKDKDKTNPRRIAFPGTANDVGGQQRKRWKSKLVTQEDPQWIHKSLGIYSLAHFLYRISIMMFGRDPAAGMGSNMGTATPTLWALVSLLPHWLLSCSLLIFDTVLRERVVGKLMIWKENRWHSILFGIRSIVCAALAWFSVRMQHVQPWRRMA